MEEARKVLFEYYPNILYVLDKYDYNNNLDDEKSRKIKKKKHIGVPHYKNFKSYKKQYDKPKNKQVSFSIMNSTFEDHIDFIKGTVKMRYNLIYDLYQKKSSYVNFFIGDIKIVKGNKDFNIIYSIRNENFYLFRNLKGEMCDRILIRVDDNKRIYDFFFDNSEKFKNNYNDKEINEYNLKNIWGNIKSKLSIK